MDVAEEAVLGIDFGTSNTVAVLAIRRRLSVIEFDGQSFMPSAVFLRDDGTLTAGSRKILLCRASCVPSTAAARPGSSVGYWHQRRSW